MSRKDYTKFSNNKVEPKPVVKQEVVIEDKPEETTSKKFMTGTVDNCKMLNVRAEPKSNAEVVRAIPVDTMVMIDPDESTDDFYKVYLADGVEGFCMKDYINVE